MERQHGRSKGSQSPGGIRDPTPPAPAKLSRRSARRRRNKATKAENVLNKKRILEVPMHCCSCSRHMSCCRATATKRSAACECKAQGKACTSCRCSQTCSNEVQPTGGASTPLESTVRDEKRRKIQPSVASFFGLPAAGAEGRQEGRNQAPVSGKPRATGKKTPKADSGKDGGEGKDPKADGGKDGVEVKRTSEADSGSHTIRQSGVYSRSRRRRRRRPGQ